MMQRRIFALSAVACVLAGGALWASEHARAVSKYAAAAREADAAADKVKGDADLRTVFESVAEAVRPSVVSIAMKRPVEMPTELRIPMGRGDEPGLGLLQRQFGQRGNPHASPYSLPEEHGVGSGMILSSDGYVLTNNHVVADASELVVRLCDGREFTATVIGADPRTDLAVLKIDALDLRPLEFADSAQLKVGQWVAAFGTPFGLDQTMSSGIVSAIGRANMHITDYEDFIQTDAAINPGNSGGPLVDLHGRVVGINTAIVSSGGGSNGVGLAIPSNLVLSIYERLIKDGKVVRGWLGLSIQDVSPALADEFAFQDQYENGARGVLVGDVTSNSPAEKAGLKPGDILTQLDGTAVSDVTHFRTAIADLAPSTGVEFVVWRDAKRIQVGATIGVAPGKVEASRPQRETGHGYGLEISDPNPDVCREFGLQRDVRGAVITNIVPGSPAAEAGLQAGDVIVEIGRVAVDDLASAARLLTARAGERIVLRVQREGASHWVELGAPARR